MQNDDFIKGTITKKDGKEIVITGTHVYNVVSVLAFIAMIYVIWLSLKTGEWTDIWIMLCLLPAVLGGVMNATKWLLRKRG